MRLAFHPLKIVKKLNSLFYSSECVFSNDFVYINVLNNLKFFDQTEDLVSGGDAFQTTDVMAQMEAEEAPVDKFAALSVAAEPECITKWKAEQEARLVAKDADEVKKREELRLQAQQELEDWYKLYEEQLEKTKASNRDEQKEFVAEINNIEAGSEWERVAIHCDFNAKVNKNVKDVSRMRSILLQLKQNPPVRS